MQRESSRATILAVDDVASNIDVLLEILPDDFVVQVATDGDSALELVAKSKPDLILLDIVLPGMDGYEICRRLKENPATSDIPIIFMTVMTEVENEAKGLEMGAVDYLTKPLQPAILRARINTHLRLKRKSDLLEKLASIDGLTEIPNRRAYNETVQREWGRCQREGEPISLVMIDVDMFKQFNDHYGHSAGDECLVKVAAALSHSVRRPGDFLARYGGEEFVAVLPDTDLVGARVMGETFRAEVEALTIPHAYSTAADVVTISLGVAVCSPAEPCSSELLQQRADEMLYVAKSQGRNRVGSIG